MGPLRAGRPCPVLFASDCRPVKHALGHEGVRGRERERARHAGPHPVHHRSAAEHLPQNPESH